MLMLALAGWLEHQGPSTRAITTIITPQRVLGLLNTCNKVGGGYPAGNDKPATPEVCESGSLIHFKAGMTIDSDGMITKECSFATDPDFRDDTTLKDSHGRPLDAAHLPYVVAPYPDEHWNFTKSGVRLGDVVAIIYEGRIRCGVLGDVGTMGEASVAMAQSLGIDPDPHQGGTSSKMTYIIFKNSRISPVEDHEQATHRCMARLAEFVRSGE
jgi:hypothetical protein